MATHCSALAWRIPGTGEPGVCESPHCPLDPLDSILAWKGIVSSSPGGWKLVLSTEFPLSLPRWPVLSFLAGMKTSAPLGFLLPHPGAGLEVPSILQGSLKARTYALYVTISAFFIM